ncbi:uncharacterized protein LOC142225115 [Haematobia irritans]|uniref:uncharacterized protein LOC142225115 n=1 Tax=Haematobia irritans TaxID=7368 RepID=UPI003F509904
MAMYYYASKISAIACGTRCRQSVLQKSRGQRDRDKHHQHHHHQQRQRLRHCGQNSCNGSPTCSKGTPGDCTTDTDDEVDDTEGGGICIRMHKRNDNHEYGSGGGSGRIYVTNTNDTGTTETSVSTLVAATDGTGPVANSMDGVRYRRRFSEQLDAYDIELGFQKFELSNAEMKMFNVMGFNKKESATDKGIGPQALRNCKDEAEDEGYYYVHLQCCLVSSSNILQNSMAGYGRGRNGTASGSDLVQYDVPRNTHKRSQCDVNFESSVLGSGGIMYINGRIVSGPLESLVDVLVPKNIIDLDKEFIFSFLLSSRLYLRPHELLGKLLSSVPDSESLESLVALLAEWTNKFPYDYRDERMMSHVKHIVARCSNTRLEAIVSEILSALLKRLTDLENHEEELRACQTTSIPSDTKLFSCPTSTQYAQILCRIEKKLAKHIGPEEFVQCSSNVLLDKQKKWDQPSSSGGPPGAQDPKKTCNLETYLDWSARLRLFVCNEILQCSGIHDRSKCVELWSGVAQYCLLVGNYNSATAILETLESPPIARLKITWSKLQVTCQQLDCMQRHAEGHGNLWHKQAIVLNESTTSSLSESAPPSSSALTAIALSTVSNTVSSKGMHQPAKPNDWVVIPVFADIVKLALAGREDCLQRLPNGHININAFDRMAAIVGAFTKHMQSVKTTDAPVATAIAITSGTNVLASNPVAPQVVAATASSASSSSLAPVTGGEYEMFCRHMQKTTRLGENGKC